MFAFSMLQLKRSWDKRMFFFFYNQISFSFSFVRDQWASLKRLKSFHGRFFNDFF